MPCISQREMLASKILEIGKYLLSGDNRNERPVEERAEAAVPWIQNAFGLAERLDEMTAVGVAELKVGSCGGSVRSSSCGM
jgi:hypothetical protein